VIDRRNMIAPIDARDEDVLPPALTGHSIYPATLKLMEIPLSLFPGILLT